MKFLKIISKSNFGPIFTCLFNYPHYPPNRAHHFPQTFQRFQERSPTARYEIGGFDHLQDIQGLQVFRAEFYVEGAVGTDVGGPLGTILNFVSQKSGDWGGDWGGGVVVVFFFGGE